MPNPRPTVLSIQTAEQIVADEKAELGIVLTASWHLFDANRFDSAQRGFERIVAAGMLDESLVTALHQIYAEQGNFEAIVDLDDRFLAIEDPLVQPATRIRWMIDRFDAVTRSKPESEWAPSVVELLETLAVAEPVNWQFVLEPERREKIARALGEPSLALMILEQMLFAPEETHLREEALARIEDIGRRNAAVFELARSAERLLHAAGEPSAGYRVETSRRASDRSQQSAAISPSPDQTTNLAGLNVTIAGGHPALRAMVGRDLTAAGVIAVREIPASWEATRDERSVQATLAASDVAVIIARQISHATSNQVRRAASRLGIAVETAESASVSAIRRAVEHYAKARGSHRKRI